MQPHAADDEVGLNGVLARRVSGLSFAEIAGALPGVTGRSIVCKPFTEATYAAEQRGQTAPQKWIDLSYGLYAIIREGV